MEVSHPLFHSFSSPYSVFFYMQYYQLLTQCNATTRTISYRTRFLSSGGRGLCLDIRERYYFDNCYGTKVGKLRNLLYYSLSKIKCKSILVNDFILLLRNGCKSSLTWILAKVCHRCTYDTSYLDLDLVLQRNDGVRPFSIVKLSDRSKQGWLCLKNEGTVSCPTDPSTGSIPGHHIKLKRCGDLW